MSAIKIAIDAGHGSNTAGKRTAPFNKGVDINQDGVIDVKKGEQYREHYANVGVSVFLKEELERCNFKTIRVAWNDSNAKDDSDVPLVDRQKIIKANKCDYSISVHFNAHGTGQEFTSPKGVCIYIHSDKTKVGDSKNLANAVLKRLCEGTAQQNRGVNPQELALCNCLATGTKASILLELAFMTNEYEAQELMANEEFWRECAIEVCKGICDYTGVKYVPKKVNPTTIYRVQVGAYSKEENAKYYLKIVHDKGFKEAQVKKVDGLYKIQAGAFSVKSNATKLKKEMKKKGIEAFITT